MYSSKKQQIYYKGNKLNLRVVVTQIKMIKTLSVNVIELCRAVKVFHVLVTFFLNILQSRSMLRHLGKKQVSLIHF